MDHKNHPRYNDSTGSSKCTAIDFFEIIDEWRNASFISGWLNVDRMGQQKYWRKTKLREWKIVFRWQTWVNGCELNATGINSLTEIPPFLEIECGCTLFCLKSCKQMDKNSTKQTFLSQVKPSSIENFVCVVFFRQKSSLALTSVAVNIAFVVVLLLLLSLQ